MIEWIHFPPAPVLGDLRVDSSEATSSSISLSWSVLSGSVVTSCEVTWQRDTEEKPGKRAPVGNSTRFNITDLHEDSMYIISLVAMNAAGRSVRATIMGLTMRTGMQTCLQLCLVVLNTYFFPTYWIPLS